MERMIKNNWDVGIHSFEIHAAKAYVTETIVKL